MRRSSSNGNNHWLAQLVSITQSQLIQIDTRNFIMDKVLTFMNQNYQIPIIHDVGFFKCDIGHQYYFSFQKEIVGSSGNVISTSNSKASFEKGLDGKGDMFVFIKLHKNHKKYSLNSMRIGQDKKIVQLYDHLIQRVNIIEDNNQKSILLEKSDGNTEYIFGEYWEHDEILKGKKYLLDSNYVYLMNSSQNKETFPSLNSPNLNLLSPQNKQPSPREMKQYQLPRSPSNKNFRVEAYEKFNITKGKGYSQFQFYLQRMPIKIDNFQNDLIIAFPNSLEIYDIRKIVKPFQKQFQNNIKDFFYEPNLQRIYLSCQKGLGIYDYK